MAKKIKRNIKAQEIIWNFLLDNAGDKFYLTQIAKETKISDSTVHQILEKQAKKELVKKEKLGNLSIYFIDLSNPLVRQQKISRALQVIEPLRKELKKWSQKIILYGSAAFGKDSKNSDIDLLVVSNEKDQVYKIFSRSKIKHKVKLVVKDTLEWVLTRNKDKFFADQIKRGQVLWNSNETI